MADRLKNCPFCGSERVILDEVIVCPERWQVRCEDCDGSGPLVSEKRVAADGWNRRWEAA